MTDTNNRSLKPSAVFLMGPTASGKTTLAADLVQRYPFEIISVDSAQVYRGMDIGTAKPDATLLARAHHRLIDIKDPAEAYSAADFREDALSEMAEITRAGNIPLLVGGTMLYFKVLREGIARLPSADPATRARIQEEAGRKGWSFMHARLKEIDPESASVIHPNNPQRIQRALEVYEVSGRALSQLQREQRAGGDSSWGGSLEAFPYNVTSIAVCPQNREVLHQRIEERFRSMLKQGFMKEVEQLYRRGDLDASMPAIRAVGYRQAWDCLDGKLSYDEMVERSIIATRQLAKRQITWLRSWNGLNWFDGDDPDLLQHVLKLLPIGSMLN